MPADLSVRGNEILMAANITRGHPWHRLGKRVESDMSIGEALKLSGSDDHVYPATLYTLDSFSTYIDDEGVERLNVRLSDVEEVAAYQSAKSNKYGTLGVHSPGFNIKQRREILEMAYDFTGLDKAEGAHIDTIGNLGDPPTQFFAYVRVPDLVIDPQGIADTIERGLFVATSFDGTLANIIGYSNIRVVCSNTLQMAMKGSSQTIRAKHTRNADERMEQIAVALDYIGAVEKHTVENAERMLQVNGGKALDSLLDHFYPVSGNLGDAVKTRRLRERADIRLMYDGDANTNVGLVGRNGWAAYNAFTEYIDHASGVRVGKDQSKAKAGVQRATRAVMPGRFVDMKIDASKIVLEMAGV